MPLMIEEGPIEARRTGRWPRSTAGETSGEHDAPERDECGCDDCQAVSRDEMWVRWA
jgi:hypothetical protein